MDEAASWGGSETRKYEYLVGTQGEARKELNDLFAPEADDETETKTKQKKNKEDKKK